jgi:phosphoribosylaminoimidazole-succinocarboxamide synthase
MSSQAGTSAPALLQTHFPTLPPPRRGKVRDIYDFGEMLLIVATDRISVFDVVLPTGIPGKGKILTQLSCFWFERTHDLVRHHLLTTDKQFARDYTTSLGWNRQPPGPELPDDIVEKTRQRYLEAYHLLVGTWPQGV